MQKTGAKRGKSGLSITVKLILFIIVIVLAAAIGTAFLAYRINADQIDKAYKKITFDSAVNFASMVDGDYLARLRENVESEEFQKLRETAEENEDEAVIQEYLENKGLWEEYSKIRKDLVKYLRNMSAIKYLYIIVIGDRDAQYDMYLMDDDDNPLYETGYYEEREPELYGMDGTTTVEPTISIGDWGWLCSAYAPVYDSNGKIVCQVGCDFEMQDVMTDRHQALMYIILAAVIFTVIVVLGAILYISRIIIRPVNGLTAEMKNFRPAVNTGYDEAGVVRMNIRSRDEIQELYEGIHTMQTNIVDYLNDMDALQKDKERAEEDIKTRDETIGQISKEVNSDALTGVGSKTAYIKEIERINGEIANGLKDFAMVMVDLNNLKEVNDKFGHRNGDLYIRGSCHLICEAFKHSPVFRIGGDEFVVLLLNVDYKNRHRQIAMLRENYEKAMIDPKAEPWEKYSASVGMAELSAEDRTADLVFKRADKAMYAEKTAFREKYGSYR